MTTIVNNPPPAKESGGGMGWIIALIVILIVGYLFVMYGIPALRQMQSGSPQINIPSKIDVNINQPAK
jgi:hypothetical protein